MSNNTTMGVHRIYNMSLQNVNASNSTGVNISELEGEFARQYVGNVAGSSQIASVLGLALIGFSMYKADVGMDGIVAVLVPSTYFMASRGWLPFSQGTIYIEILLVAGLLMFGLFRWADR